MATAAEHLAQADYNESVADLLATAGYYDWALTALFYAALQLIQVVLVQSEVSVATHGQRAAVMEGLASLVPVQDHYLWLKSLSENARYECRHLTVEQFAEARDSKYAAISTHIRGLLRLGSAL